MSKVSESKLVASRTALSRVVLESREIFAREALELGDEVECGLEIRIETNSMGETAYWCRDYGGLPPEDLPRIDER